MSEFKEMQRKIESMRKYLSKWYKDTDNKDRPNKNHIAVLLQDISEIQQLANGFDASDSKLPLCGVINCTDLEPDFVNALNQLVKTQRQPTKKRF